MVIEVPVYIEAENEEQARELALEEAEYDASASYFADPMEVSDAEWVEAHE